MRRNGDRGLVGGDREKLDRGYGFHRTGDRWLPDRWLGMPGSGVVIPPPPFDPTQIAGLQAWWKADSLALGEGAPVTSWLDSSGNGHTASEVTSPPVFKTNLYNGKPAVRFVAASSQKLTFAPAISSLTPWTSVTVMAAASLNTGQMFGAIGGSGQSPYGAYLYGTPPPNLLLIADRSQYASVSNWAAGLHIFIGICNGATRKLYVNGIDALVGADTPYGPSVLNFDSLGRTDVTFAGGDLTEQLLYSVAVTPADVTNLTAFFKSKYGLAFLRDAIKREVRKEILKLGLLVGTMPGPEVPE